MDSTVFGAMLGVSGTLVVGFLANFVSEDYRRFRDGKALAAGLAGELASYREAYPMLDDMLDHAIVLSDAGELVSLPRIEKPVDLVFSENVSKLGSLGPTLAVSPKGLSTSTAI